jgi:hypothetical protein
MEILNKDEYEMENMHAKEYPFLKIFSVTKPKPDGFLILLSRTH